MDYRNLSVPVVELWDGVHYTRKGACAAFIIFLLMGQLGIYITILSLRYFKLKRSEQKESVFHLMKFIEQEDWHLEAQYNAYVEEQDALLKKKMAEAEAKKNSTKKPAKGDVKKVE